MNRGVIMFIIATLLSLQLNTLRNSFIVLNKCNIKGSETNTKHVVCNYC